MQKEIIRIEKEELLKIDRKARRDMFIKEQIPHRGHQVHKTKKDYNRQQFKKQAKQMYHYGK